ncbi:MAG: hypothetical protein Q9P90_00855 [candidate division KSB1 bacterium]|nr:hypothetical protein [candidate division KSB1 bacterium]
MGCAQSFADFVARVGAAPDSARTALIDRFMQAIPQFPFRETASTVHLIYRGPASTVAVPGDANGWNPRRAAMQRLANTDLWHRSETFMPVGVCGDIMRIVGRRIIAGR